MAPGGQEEPQGGLSHLISDHISGDERMRKTQTNPFPCALMWPSPARTHVFGLRRRRSTLGLRSFKHG